MPIIAVIAPGAMGSGVGRRLVENGNTVLTSLENRSSASRERARAAGMVDASISEIVRQADFVLSILPPSDAYSLAELFVKELQTGNRASDTTSLIYADCNAVNPVTVKKIASLFSSSSAAFIDGGIIGGPPNGTYNPTFYVSADIKDQDALTKFEKLRNSGLQITTLSGTGAGIGDASALKMSYAGISKGMTGVFATMLLAAHASSPATSEALLQELKASQPMVLQRIVNSIPPMLPKAYRWVGEMHEIAGFVGEGGGELYNGIANTYARVEKSIEEGNEDVKVLESLVQAAKRYLSEQ